MPDRYGFALLAAIADFCYISLILHIDSDTNVRNTELDARRISYLRTSR